MLTQSEELPVAEQPLTYPLYGTLLDLQDVRVDLAAVQAVAIYRQAPEAQRQCRSRNMLTLCLTTAQPTSAEPGRCGHTARPRHLPLESDGTIPDWTTLTVNLTLRGARSQRQGGHARRTAQQLHASPASSKDRVVQEFALVSSISAAHGPVSRARGFT